MASLAAFATTCDVREFGALGDNVTEDTLAVAAALRACQTVVLPAGHTFLLRPVRLPSNSHLIVDGDIAAWRDIYSWPNSTHKKCATTPYGLPANETKVAPQLESVLWAVNSTNVTVSGQGTLDGQGWRWWPLRNNMSHGDYWHNCRPKLMSFGTDQAEAARGLGVTDLTVSGITLKDSPFWTFSGRWLKRALISRVHVTTSGCGYGQAPNTDGFNLQGEQMVVEHCTVRNGDDCVPLFPPSRDVLVRNLSCSCGNGLTVAVWPALSKQGDGGDVRDVVFDSATLNGTANAISVKSLPPFVGRALNISFTNVRLQHVGTPAGAPATGGAAIAINFLGQGDAPPANAAGGVGATAAHLLIENVSGTALHGGHFTCTDALPCSGIRMRNVRLTETHSGAPVDNYTCTHAGGSFEACSPPPCGWPETPAL